MLLRQHATIHLTPKPDSTHLLGTKLPRRDLMLSKIFLRSASVRGRR
jgi:hypothetical protein